MSAFKPNEQWFNFLGFFFSFLLHTQVNVTVIRSQGSLGSVLVTYETSGYTAVSGTDFSPASGRLLFTPGQTSQELTLQIQDDSLPEGPEVFFINITSVDLVNLRLLHFLKCERIGGVPLTLLDL